MAEGYTIPVTKEMVSAKTTLRISNKHAHTVCKYINKMPFAKAKNFIAGLIKETSNIDGRYYTKTSINILDLLKLLESNAINREIVPDEMKLYISAHMGPNLMRGRRKRRFGYKIKITHVQAILKPTEKSKMVEKKKVEPKKKEAPKKKETPVKKETEKTKGGKN